MQFSVFFSSLGLLATLGLTSPMADWLSVCAYLFVIDNEITCLSASCLFSDCSLHFCRDVDMAIIMVDYC